MMARSKDSAKKPKKGGKTKNRSYESPRNTALQANDEELDDIDDQMQRLQQRKESTVAARTSVAASKGSRNVRSIYATVPVRPRVNGSDSLGADNESESSDFDDGQRPTTSKRNVSPLDTLSDDNVVTPPHRGRPVYRNKGKRKRHVRTSSSDESVKRQLKSRSKKKKRDERRKRFAPPPLAYEDEESSEESDSSPRRRKRDKKARRRKRRDDNGDRARFAPGRPAHDYSSEEDSSDDDVTSANLARKLKSVISGKSRRKTQGIVANYFVGGITISSKLKNQVWKGEYIELGSLMPKKEIRSSNGGDDGQSTAASKGKAPANIAEWCYLFNIFASVYTQKYPYAAPQLFTYVNKITAMQKRDRYTYIWRYYDELFRKLKSECPKMVWHLKNEAVFDDAVDMHERVSNGTRRSRYGDNDKQTNQKKTRTKSKNTCRKWNWKTCKYTDCIYAHVCALCRGAHTAQTCKTAAAEGAEK